LIAPASIGLAGAGFEVFWTGFDFFWFDFLAV